MSWTLGTSCYEEEIIFIEPYRFSGAVIVTPKPYWWLVTLPAGLGKLPSKVSLNQTCIVSVTYYGHVHRDLSVLLSVLESLSVCPRYLTCKLDCVPILRYVLVAVYLCRSQWPRSLRHELSSLTRTLGSWVRMPLKEWMSVCGYSVFVLFCV
jgi:hypothetical protein